MKSTACACVLILLSLLPAACGGDRDGPSEGHAASRVLPDLPAVTDEEKAAFALERLLHGPLPRTGAFVIPRIHLLSLEHARADLVALGRAALELLSQPDLLEEVTRPDGDRNPWHNILQVLAWWDAVPVDVAMRWCRPALAVNDLQLDRRAVRVLGNLHDAQDVGALLAEFLAKRPRDRELSPAALRALSHLGSPSREGALDVILRDGSPHVWGRVPDALARTAPKESAPWDALAWWALLAEHATPIQPRASMGQLGATWFLGRLLVDDAVWPRDAQALDLAMREGRVLAPASVVDAPSHVPVPPGVSDVLSWRQLLLSGRATAAEARCRLAESGFETYRATVRRDLAAADAGLSRVAEACRLGTPVKEGDLELEHAVLSAFLEDLENGVGPSPTGVPPALASVVAAARDEGLDAAVRILRHARPPDAYQGLLEMAHDILAKEAAERLTEVFASLLASDREAEDVATALLLIRRGRNPAHAALLEDVLARAEGSDTGLIRRLLIWLQSVPGGSDAETLERFVARYAEWLRDAPDGEARGLAPGLLDLGAPGAAAYAAGLGGPRRALFVQGLLGRRGLVPLEVARALLDPVDETTSPKERWAVLVAAYRVAPADAAPSLAGLRERIAESVRSEVDDVLAVVRHRASRER